MTGIWQEAMLMQAMCNLLLAMHGKPEPRNDDQLADIARQINLLARQIRLENLP